MKIVLLTAPIWIMFAGVAWVFVAAARARGDRPSQVVRRAFARMSLAVGAAFVIWCGLTLALGIIKPAYPLVIGGVGLLLALQGFVFARFKVF
ncbi:MAG TPA: hypothetical protein VGE07_05505 [Herpetosiphonaceae bacterium]